MRSRSSVSSDRVPHRRRPRPEPRGGPGRKAVLASGTGPKWPNRSAVAPVADRARCSRAPARRRCPAAAWPAGARRRRAGGAEGVAGEDRAGRGVRQRHVVRGVARRVEDLERAGHRARSSRPSSTARIRSAGRGSTAPKSAAMRGPRRRCAAALATSRVGSARCGAPRSCTQIVARGKRAASAPTPPAWSRWMCVTTTCARSSGPDAPGRSSPAHDGAARWSARSRPARAVPGEQVGGGDPVAPGHHRVDPVMPGAARKVAAMRAQSTGGARPGRAVPRA